MIKKMLAFAATAIFSLNASAEYVKYNFSEGDLTGFIIEHTNDKTIAAYSLVYKSDGKLFSFSPSGPFSNISAETTHFAGAGPTSAVFFSDLSELYHETLTLDLTGGPTTDTFAYYGDYSAVQNVSVPGQSFPSKHYGVTGLVTQAAVDPELAAYLDSSNGYPDGIAILVPTLVPEPTSIALLALGGIAAFSQRRRKK